MSSDCVTVLDLIQKHFGDEVGPDLITALAGRLPPEFGAFQEEYRSWTRQIPRVPGRPQSHLRPFITGTYYLSTPVPLYDLVFRGDESKIFSAIDAIKHQLLYCHSVALENPLQHLLRGDENLPVHALASMRGGLLGFRVNGGPLFRRYLTLLSYLRPLIESGALILVEAHWGVVRRPIELPRDEMQSLIEGLNIDTAGYFPGEPDDDETQRRAKASMVGVCLEYLRFVSRVREKTGDAVDLAIGEPAQRLVFRHIQRCSAALAPPEIREYEMRLLHHLLRLRLPRLEELSEADIRAIRDQGEFAEWRQALTLALDRFDRESLSSLSAQEAAEHLRSQILLALEPLMARIEHEVRRSSFLRKLRQGAFDISVGLGIDCLLGSLGAATTAAIAKQGLIAVYKALQESRQNKGTALESHYLLFENSSPAGSN